jgi:Leucine-rich repeat (LRR) protein
MANDLIYQQLTSGLAKEIKQGIGAAKSKHLLEQEPIRTALICLGYFQPQLIQRAFSSGIDKPDYLYKIGQNKASNVSKTLTDLLNYVVGNPKEKVDIDTVKIFVKRHCQKVEKLKFNHKTIAQVPATLLSPQTLPSLHSIGLARLSTIPDFVFSFDNLKHFSFRKSKLTTLPKALTQLQQLETLDFSDNALEQLPDGLAQLPQLQALNVSSNRLTQLPNNLSNLGQLETLNVANNLLTELPPDIGSLPKIQQIDVGFNYLLSLPQGLIKPQLKLKGWANPYVKLNRAEAKALAQDYRRNKNDNPYSQRYSKSQCNTYGLFLYAFGYQHGMRLKAAYELSYWLKFTDKYSIFEKLLLFAQAIPHLPIGFDQDFADKLLNHYVIATHQEAPFDKLKALFGRFDFSVSSLSKQQLIEILTNVQIQHLAKYVMVASNTNDPDILEHLVYTKNIHQLNLSKKRLEEFPEWLLKYQALTYLNLSNNELKTVPVKRLRFERLRNLILSDNQLVSLPEEADTEGWHLPELTSLDLSQNALVRLPENDWQKLPKLQKLKLDYNWLTHLPNGLQALPTLTKVSVKHNRLAHLPEVWYTHKVVQLNDFLHNYCDILPSLKANYLAYLERGEALSAQVFTNLFCLILFHHDEEIRHITFKQIQYSLFALEQDVLQSWEYSPQPDYIELLFFLDRVLLTFELSLIWDGIETWISRLALHSTKRVLMSNLRLTSLPDFTLKYWQNPWVDFSHNAFEQLPTTLEHLLNLSRLDMSYNLLTKLSNEEAMRISQVKTLNLSHNFIEQVPLHLFTELPRLANLNLSHNYLSELPEAMHLPKCKKLDLSHNLFTQIQANITQLAQLQHLNLSYNQLGLSQTAPALPLEISHFDKLTHLDLSYNFLSVLPMGIGLIEQLKQLDLSHNRLQEVPVGLYDSLTLEVLDLSYNALEQLPDDLAEITTLQQLILSGNPLPPTELQKVQGLLPNTTIIFEQKVTKVENVAQELLSQAQDLYAQGKAHLKKGEEQASVVCLKKAAILHFAPAFEALAQYHYPRHNIAKARYWYSKAAAQGDEGAAKTYEQLFGIKIMK